MHRASFLANVCVIILQIKCGTCINAGLHSSPMLATTSYTPREANTAAHLLAQHDNGHCAMVMGEKDCIST
jgi:hypothetical protein